MFLKLRPYRQSSISKRICQKLATKFYGPFQIVERIGKATYRLQLPVESKIHHVFHISQLKQVLGTNHIVMPLPQSLSDTDEIMVKPEQLLETRYSDSGILEPLVKWKGLPVHESSWEEVRALAKQFPD